MGVGTPRTNSIIEDDLKECLGSRIYTEHSYEYDMSIAIPVIIKLKTENRCLHEQIKLLNEQINLLKRMQNEPQ